MEPNEVKHTIHLLPQNTTLEELAHVTEELHPTRSAFTYSADVAHAVMAHGTAGSKVVAWSPDRWPDDILDWLEGRGIEYAIKFFPDDIRDWEPLPPVGDNRVYGEWPPEQWIDVNPYGNLYTNPSTGNKSYHTGADLNLNTPFWDADRNMPVYPILSGVVTFAGSLPVWGNVLIIKHSYDGMPLYTRYAHLASMMVQVNDRVLQSTMVGRIGQDALGGPFHLHFDISDTSVLLSNPGHWPGSSLAGVLENYLDPEAFFAPESEEAPPPGYAYRGRPVTFKPAIHAPGSDWQWPESKGTIDRLGLAIKAMTNGTHPENAAGRDVLISRVFWAPQNKPVERAWEEDIKEGVQKSLSFGIKKFELLNEPNLDSEGFGWLWRNPVELANWLIFLTNKIKALDPTAQVYFPGFSPGIPWTNQFALSEPTWKAVKSKMDGFCLHVYSGRTDDPQKAATEMVSQVLEAQRYLNLQLPLIVSESSVNRGTDYKYKARVYKAVEGMLAAAPGIEGVCWFISLWSPPPEQAAHGESWVGTPLPDEYLALG